MPIFEKGATPLIPVVQMNEKGGQRQDLARRPSFRSCPACAKKPRPWQTALEEEQFLKRLDLLDRRRGRMERQIALIWATSPWGPHRTTREFRQCVCFS